MVKIPTRLDDLLPSAAMEKVMEVLHQPDISNTVRDALNKVGLKDANPLGQVQQAWRQTRSWLDKVAAQIGTVPHNPATINATGQWLTPEFDSSPMAASVLMGFAKAAAVFQDSDSLRLSSTRVAAEVFNRPTAWLGSGFAALQLLRLVDASPGGILISRADTVRVPAFGDVRLMLTAMGGELTEVGAANGAFEQDWGAAVTSNQQSLLLVSPNNLSAEAAGKQRTAAIDAAKQVGAKVIELLVDGVVSPPLAEKYGFPEVKQCLASGADLVILPLNFLLAAPNAAIAVGDEKLVAAMERAAGNLGARCSGPELAASIIAVQTAAAQDEKDAGAAGRLMANLENLKNRARRLAIQLNDTEKVLTAVDAQRKTPLGPTPWNRYQLENWCVRLTLRDASADDAADRLREELMKPKRAAPEEPHTPALASAVDGNELLIDLRFVEPENDHEIVLAFEGLESK